MPPTPVKLTNTTGDRAGESACIVGSVHALQILVQTIELVEPRDYWLHDSLSPCLGTDQVASLTSLSLG